MVDGRWPDARSVYKDRLRVFRIVFVRVDGRGKVFLDLKWTDIIENSYSLIDFFRDGVDAVRIQRLFGVGIHNGGTHA